MDKTLEYRKLELAILVLLHGMRELFILSYPIKDSHKKKKMGRGGDLGEPVFFPIDYWRPLLDLYGMAR